MSGYDDLAPRRVVPRWRDSKVLRGVAEEVPISTALAPRATALSSEHLSNRLKIWQADPSVGLAADLVGAAFLSGHYETARDAAKYLLARGATIPRELTSLARAILGYRDSRDEFRKSITPREEIGEARERLRAHFQNPILLVDTARHFSALGQNEKAKRFMNAALHLMPNHRFILRAASRLLVHLDEPDIALRLIRTAASTPGDPWLVAAEISLAAVAGKKSALLSRGAAMLKERRFAPSQTTELSSAVASEEFSHGKNRVAKRFFIDSLISPNDNSIAQVEWANRRGKLGLPVDEKVLEVPLTFEAQFWVNYEHREETLSKTLVKQWALDEPFSSRPIVMGTFLASIYEDYELGRELGEAGLIANPDDEQIINNLAFIEASEGNLARAWQRIQKFQNFKSPHFVANAGLIAYRMGDIKLGRQCYRAAIALAKRVGQPQTEVLASLFFSREAMLAGDPEATKVVEAAERLVRLQGTTSSKVVWERLQPQVRSSVRPHRAAGTNQGKLERFDEKTVKEQVSKIVPGDE